MPDDEVHFVVVLPEVHRLPVPEEDGADEVLSKDPKVRRVPVGVPGEFVVYLGVDDVSERLEAGMAELLLTWLEWVEVEIQGVDDGLVEELERLRGAVMLAGLAGGGAATLDHRRDVAVPPPETYMTRGGESTRRKEVDPAWTIR